MNSFKALYLLMTNQKKVRDDFRFVDLHTLEKVSIEDCYDLIKEDLEILECFKKIPKQDLREFIEWQLRYEKMIKNWLDERPFLYVDKEDPTTHLIKIKEWLENE